MGSQGYVNGSGRFQNPYEASMDGEQPRIMPLAIVGMGCRFPGDSNSPELLWELLSKGKSGWARGAGDRFQSDAFYHPAAELGGVFNTQGFHLLGQDVAGFDAPFFNISPSEAKSIDPQQRLLLEVAYEAFENAGISIENLSGSNTGVYVAAFNSDYERMLSRDPENVPPYRATGTGIAIQANRISYVFNLAGPSLSLDTGCSGSLVALHQACNAIRSGEIDQALVGGSNLILDPELTSSLSSMRLLGDNGRCFTFDQRASGYGRGEGVAAIVVKHLQRALDDGDCIRAVIRNTVVNQDGRTQGITMPSGSAQKSMMRKAYADAALDPGATSYVEAHGTGTEVGDAIEAEAIASVFLASRKAGHSIVVGSIKTNIGHTESTAGLAGLIKTVLMLERNEIAPNHDFQHLSKQLPAMNGQFEVPKFLQPWPSSGMRRASVNSFGYGGTNAHVVLDAAETYLPQYEGARLLQRHPKQPQQQRNDDAHYQNGNEPHSDSGRPEEVPPMPESHGNRLVVFSAVSRDALRNTIENFKSYAISRQESDAEMLDSLAYTISCRRSLLPFRLYRTAATVAELLSTLADDSLQNDVAKSQKSPDRPRVCFVFNGQGAQWAGMARELFGACPVFENSIHRAQDRLRDLGANWTLKTELIKAEKVSRVNSASMSQALCTAIQIALVDLFFSWNVRPDVVVGHSSGEIAAAYAAGALTFDDAICVAYHRGQLMDQVDQRLSGTQGAMMAVGLSADQTIDNIDSLPRANGQICVACINSPSSVTVSGDRRQILALQEALKAKSVFNRLLLVDKAYHSYHMGTIYDEYVRALGEITPRGFNGSTRMISTVLGENVVGHDLGATYWGRNMVSPVRFSEALGKFCTEQLATQHGSNSGDGIILEIGPHSALAGPIRQIQRASKSNMGYNSALIRNINASKTVLDAAGSLCTQGIPVNLTAVNALRNPQVLRDYPSYAWDHSTHWHESRLSKQFLQRKAPRHSLLGVLSPDNNPLEPKWRNYLKVADIPWIRGHALQGSMVYPASGFICMALEAIRQQARSRGETDRNVLYILREVNITRALLVPDDLQGVETVFSLRPYPQSARGSSAVWSEFRVFSVANGSDWGEHCRGLISVQPHVSADEVEGNRENATLANLAQERFAAARRDCKLEIPPSELYSHLTSVSNDYTGPFRNLTSILTAPLESLCTFNIPDVQQTMPGVFDQPHILHPVTLDLCIQTILPALLSMGKLDAPTVINYVEELTIVSDIEFAPGAQYLTNLTATQTASSKYKANIIVQQASELKSPLAIIGKGLGYTTLPMGSDNTDEKSEYDRRLCHRLEWVPDITRASPQDAQSMCSSVLSEESGRDPFSRFDRRARYLIRKTLSSLKPEDEERMLPYQALQLNWMRKNAFEDDEHLSSEPVDHLGAHGEMLERICSNLVDILKGNTHPLTIMTEGDLLYRCYSDKGVSRCITQVAEYLRMACQKNPAMRILEIGAGTGSATVPILKAVSSLGGQLGIPQLSQYTFTDISAGFFEKAKELLRPWLDVVEFQKLDIEQPTPEQGFEDGGFDVVIACNVLHATKSISKTLCNVRRLLKPDGKLCLIEVTQPSVLAGLVFGTLPGWWLGAGEDGRNESPLLRVDEWSTRLTDNLFSGIDLLLPDYAQDQDHRYDAMVSTAAVKDAQNSVPNIEIISTAGEVKSAGNPKDGSFAREIVRRLMTLAASDDSLEVALEEASPAGKIVVVTLELTHPFLAFCDESSFEHIKRVFSLAKGVVWLTNSGALDCANPLNSLVTGLMRSARSENRLARLLTVDIDVSQESPGLAASILFKLLRTTFESDDATGNMDFEYTIREGKILLPRLVEDEELNQSMDAGQGSRTLREECFFQEHRNLALNIGTAGLLETMAWADTTRNQELAQDDIRIEFRYGALNFRNLMVALGQLEGFNQMVNECSGTVLEVGTNAKSSFQVGDRVCMVGGDAYASSSVVSMHNACVIPDTMSFEVAASIPVAYTTAYYSLCTIGNLQKGESVLIHSAAGALGQAAVALARHIGAIIFVTVGSSKKKSFMMSNFDIPEENIFSSRLTNFSRGIKRLTGDKGVDVILNSLAADTVRESCTCIGKFGRFIEVGKRDASVNGRLDMEMFGRHVMFAAVDLALIYTEKPRLFKELLSCVVELVAQKKVDTIRPVEVKPLEQIEAAYRLMQSGKHMGKILLKADSSTKVKVVTAPPSRARFREDGWYVVAGGLGGLGQAIIRWMANAGARNIIAISRSGGTSPRAVELAKEMGLAGINLRIQALDVTDATQVQKVLELTGNKRVSGVIQGAMVLKDAPMNTMSFQQWREALNPKVQGTLNLYNVLGGSLDFFIMLSSATGLIGSYGQCNYAAGSTFQDAFARSMALRGHPVRSLDLAGIASAGYVAEHSDSVEFLERQGLRVVKLEKLMTLLNHAVNQPSSRNMVDSQVTLGLGFNQSLDGGRGSDAMFSHISARQHHKAGSLAKEDVVDVAKALRDCESRQQALELATEGILRKLSQLLAMNLEDLNASQSLSAYGADSLIAAELRNWLAMYLQAQVQTLELLGTASIRDLSAIVVSRSKLVPSFVVA